ncbi:MAG TPA: nuclear transport factor 2 family protein [Terriglobales bacterium]|nr:nuclear transport factor 2 family protein [Terriglobales bacterium]
MMAIALIFLAIGQLAYSQEANQGRAASSEARDKIIAELRSAYAAFNRGDFEAAVASLDPKIDWSEPVEFPGGGTYHGRAEVKRYLMQSRAGWAEGSSEPKRFIPAGNRIVVFVYAHFRPKDSNEWQQVRLADVYSVRKGRIVQMKAFSNRQAALAWAGAKIPKEK